MVTTRMALRLTTDGITCSATRMKSSCSPKAVARQGRVRSRRAGGEQQERRQAQ